MRRLITVSILIVAMMFVVVAPAVAAPAPDSAQYNQLNGEGFIPASTVCETFVFSPANTGEWRAFVRAAPSVGFDVSERMFEVVTQAPDGSLVYDTYWNISSTPVGVKLGPDQKGIWLTGWAGQPDVWAGEPIPTVGELLPGTDYFVVSVRIIWTGFYELQWNGSWFDARDVGLIP